MGANDEKRNDGKIVERDIEKEMRTAYIDYAMSVIVARALPDVRDGLKPVHRRILYAMYEDGITSDKPYRKCANTVGSVLGRYHPHGDASVYDAMVRLAQDFTQRYTLIDGHGNFGSIDGDGAAAMRYTEARMAKIAETMLTDIEKNTVDFMPNYDDRLQEPTVLPAKIPALLINGSSGIAVGMATNIPPHNLTEVIDGIIKIIDEDNVTDEQLMEIIKGPDFPTEGLILGLEGIKQAYTTGRGKITVRGESEIEEMSNNKQRIIVNSLPYQVNKAKLIENIADLVKDKKIEGISEIRDESDRESKVRIVIELKRDVNAQVILNQLYKHTQLQDTFGVIMLALVDNQPKVLNLYEMLKYYLMHQEDVVTRRTKYDLNKAEERAHILEGLIIALDNIDRVISIIRGSSTVQAAKESLMKEFNLTDAQSQAIVDMRLRALTGLERSKIEAELADLQKKIEEYRAILADKNKLLTVIKTEISLIADKYGDERRTSIGYDEYDLSMEDLIPDEACVIARTNMGYVKRMTPDNFKSQHRGGKGIKGMQTLEEDYIKDLFMTTSHHVLTFFTNTGRAYKLKAYEIPEAGRTSRGTAIINLLQLAPGETITAVVPVKVEDISDNDYLFMATKNGIVKKTPCREFANIRKNGIQAMTLRDDDELIEVKLTDDTTEVMMVTKLGMCIRFKATDVRPTGRSAMGVIGMNLMDTDEVVGVQLNTQGDTMLIVSENGMGKKTDISEYAVQHRGGKGVKCYKITEKTGNVIGAKAVDDTREVMLITTEGIIIRLACRDISTLGRITSGVKLINLDDNVKVATVSKVRKSPSGDDGNETEEFDAESDSENIDGVNKVNENTSDSNTSDVADDSIDRLLDAANKDNQED